MAARKMDRRRFLETAGKGVVASSVVAGFPAIVPPRCSGPHRPATGSTSAPSAPGASRAATTCPASGSTTSRAIDGGRATSTARRLEDAKTLVNGYYAKKTGQALRRRDRLRELPRPARQQGRRRRRHQHPDHWHCLIAIDAVEAGKDVYLQKPASLTIAEGRALSDAVQRSGRIFQIGSQQRSTVQFRYAAELVRNGRIGQLEDGRGGPARRSVRRRSSRRCPSRKNLNYDMWLGSTPVVYYTEKRVHPQVGYDRPGWLRCEQFGAGMITGWGAHHIDSAHWGMDTELHGPGGDLGHGRVPEVKGLWDVHGPFKTEALYANGVHMIVSGDFPNGIKFIGTNGWIFVSRGNETVTAQRSGGEAEGRDGSRRQRSEDHHVRDRARRDPPAGEHGAPPQLARVREVAQAADRARRGRAPRPARPACSITWR